MNFTPIPCHESLRPFVRNYWMITAHCTETGTQQIFSNGAASLQFYLSQSVSLRTDGGLLLCADGEVRRYRTVLFHQDLNRVGVVSEPGPFLVFGAEFVPFCSRLFLAPPSQDVGEDSKCYAPEDMHDEAFMALCCAVHAARDTGERVSLLDEFFLNRLSEIPADDVNIERLTDVFGEMIDPSRPLHEADEMKPSDLASTACLSQKQFTRVFNKYVGMTPKAYLRLLRFHKALMALQHTYSSPLEGIRGGLPSLTDIAWHCGYYDLPHMTADFRDICGYSPSELLSQGKELTETFGQKFSGLMKKKIKIENLV